MDPMGFATELILIIRVGGFQHPLLKLLAEIPKFHQKSHGGDREDRMVTSVTSQRF